MRGVSCSKGKRCPRSELRIFSKTFEYTVEPEYLKTMRIPLLRGRFLSDEDNENARRVVVIDASFAQQYFAGQDPIGKQVRIFEFDSDSNQRLLIPLVIVGVVGHVNQWGLAEDASHPLQAQMYRSIMQNGAVYMKGLAQGFNVFVRSKTPLAPEAFFESIRQKLLASNRDMIVYDNESEEEVVAQLDRQPAFLAHPAGRICRAGPVAGRHWNLWRAVVSGGAADAGNRCAHGSWSPAP